MSIDPAPRQPDRHRGGLRGPGAVVLLPGCSQQILGRVTLLPGVPRAAVRQLRVPADANAVMEWLTDSDRREREWRRQAEARGDIQHASVVRLPNGGLRVDSVLVRGDLVARHVIEDVAIQEHRIDRILRGQAARRHRRSRWVVKQRITVKSLGAAANVTVRTRGRPVGKSLALHFLLGSNDTTAARFLTEEASRFADFVASGVAGHFTGLGGTEP